MPRFKEDIGVATALGVASTNLPSRGLGIAGGAHWYPVRMGRLDHARHRRRDSDQPRQQHARAGNGRRTPRARQSRRGFRPRQPQVSLNFGKRQGWSYLTGGIGWAGFRTELEASPVADSDSRPRASTTEAARAGSRRNISRCALDLRFYAVSAQEAAVGRPAYPSMTLMVISGGISLK